MWPFKETVESFPLRSEPGWRSLGWEFYSEDPLHPFQKNEAPLYLGREGTVSNTRPFCLGGKLRGLCCCQPRTGPPSELAGVHNDERVCGPLVSKTSRDLRGKWRSEASLKRTSTSRSHTLFSLLKIGVSLTPSLENQKFSLYPSLPGGAKFQGVRREPALFTDSRLLHRRTNN